MFEVMFIKMFYIVIDFIFIRKIYVLYIVIFKNNSGYIYKNVLYIMKFIFTFKTCIRPPLLGPLKSGHQGLTKHPYIKQPLPSYKNDSFY